jgi:hypothetical protein
MPARPGAQAITGPSKVSIVYDFSSRHLDVVSWPWSGIQRNRPALAAGNACPPPSMNHEFQALKDPSFVQRRGLRRTTNQSKVHRREESKASLPRAWSGFPHVDHTSNAVAGVHVVERFVDLVQGLSVRDEFVHLELAIHIVLNQTRKLGAALDTAEGTAAPDSLQIRQGQYVCYYATRLHLRQ